MTAQLTRRALWRVCGLAGLLRAISTDQLHAQRLGWEAQPDSRGASTRNYRADAEIVLLSIPVLRRSGVGAGSSTWSENGRFRLLDFTGYSFPARAAGLNRFGFIRELSRKEADAAETLYFGLMTASPEESAAEAKKALYKEAHDQLFTAIEGRVASGNVETLTAHFTASGNASVAQHEQLLSLARHALAAAPQKPADFDPGSGSHRTFLHALAYLLEDSSRDHTRYVYNAHLYSLSLRRSPDPKATAYFRGKRLIAQDATVLHAEGKLRREAGGKETNFRLWVEQGGRPLPLRIEYQAKPYLRLTFEVDDSAGVPNSNLSSIG